MLEQHKLVAVQHDIRRIENIRLRRIRRTVSLLLHDSRTERIESLNVRIGKEFLLPCKLCHQFGLVLVLRHRFVKCALSLLTHVFGCSHREGNDKDAVQ